MTTNPNPGPTGEDAVLDIMGAGSVADVDIFEGGRTQLTESGTDPQVSNIRGGVTAKVKTGTSYAVDLPAPATGKVWNIKETTNTDVALGKLEGNSFTVTATGKTASVTLEQVAAEPGSDDTDKVTLTLKGLLAGTSAGTRAWDVYVKAPGAAGYSQISMKANSWTSIMLDDGTTVASEQYDIVEGSAVRILSKNTNDDTTFVAADAGVYTINSVDVTVTDGSTSAKDQLDLTLSKELTLYVKAKSTFDDGTASTPTKQFTLKSVGGVTGTFTYTDTTKGSKALSANGSILIDGAGKFTVGEVGDGKYVNTSDVDSTANNAKIAGGEFNIAGNANVTLYSGIKVTTAAGISSTGTTLSAGATTFVAHGKVLTLAGGDTNDQYIVYTGDNVTTKAPQTTGKWTVSGKEDVTIDDTVKFTLGEGVKAEYGSSTKVSLDAGVWYMAKNDKKTLTLEAVDKENQKVVWPATKSGMDMTSSVLSYYVESVQPGNNDTYEAYTILETTDMDDLWTFAGGISTDVFSDVYNVTNETLNAAELGGGTITAKRIAGTLYVKPGTQFYICAKTQGECDVIAETADGTSVIVAGTANRGGSSASALAEIIVGKLKVMASHTEINP